MRMRMKKHFDERLAACAHLLCEKPEEPITTSEYHFGWDGDIYLEIGCGKGGFAVQSAAANPEVCFYAMERVANVMVNAVERAEREKASRPDNLRFMIDSAEHLAEWFAPHTLSAIYLNFSDPWPKKRNAKRRLTHRNFLALYFSLLKEDGMLYFKTDNVALFDFTLEQLEEMGHSPSYVTRDLHNSPLARGNIMTEYESNFVSQGMPIHALAVSPHASKSILPREILYSSETASDQAEEAPEEAKE